jgi:hypothetical protein
MGEPALVAPTPIAEHSFRRSVLETGRRFSLYPRELVFLGDGREERIPLSAVRRVHLRYHRTKQRTYYQLRITLEGGRQLFAQDQSWAGFAKFDDRGATYKAFVLALHEALLPFRDQVEFRAGNLGSFLMTLLMSPIVAALLGVMLLTRRWLIAIGVGLVLLTLLQILPRVRPRGYAPEAPPPSLLP